MILMLTRFAIRPFLDDVEDEHGKLRGQIEQLKTALEHAQVVRRRKIEYDAVTEKVNTLPSREELEQYVSFQVSVACPTRMFTRIQKVNNVNRE